MLRAALPPLSRLSGTGRDMPDPGELGGDVQQQESVKLWAAESRQASRDSLFVSFFLSQQTLLEDFIGPLPTAIGAAPHPRRKMFSLAVRQLGEC